MLTYESKPLFIFLTVAFFFSGLLFIESITYIGFWSRFFSSTISVWHFIAIGILSLFGLQFYLKTYLPSKIWYSFFSVFCLLSIIACVFFFLESTHYPNYVFSTFHVHPNLFWSLPTFMWLVLLINSFFSKQTVTKAGLLVISSYVLATLLRLANPSLFELLGSEDQLIEWASVVALLAISGAAGLQLRFYKKMSVWKRFILCSIIVVFLFIAAEEISWGQRLFNLQTNQKLAEINVQDEITIHNISFIQDKMFYAYFLVGVAGSFGWVAKPFLTKPKQHILIKEAAAFIPGKKWAIFFVPILIYSIARIITGPINYKTWEEFAELLLFTGFALSLIPSKSENG